MSQRESEYIDAKHLSDVGSWHAGTAHHERNADVELVQLSLVNGQRKLT